MKKLMITLGCIGVLSFNTMSASNDKEAFRAQVYDVVSSMMIEEISKTDDIEELENHVLIAIADFCECITDTMIASVKEADIRAELSKGKFSDAFMEKHEELFGDCSQEFMDNLVSE